MTGRNRAKRGMARHRRPQARAPKTVTPERWVAWRAIDRVLAEGAYADHALRAESDRADLDSQRRRAAQMLALGTIERAGTIDHLVAAVGKRPLARIDAPLLAAIRLGCFQMICTDEADHASVDQSVEIVRASLGERPVPFANAVLRRIQAHAATLLDDLPQTSTREAVIHSLPVWMVEHDGGALVRELAAQNRTTLVLLGRAPVPARPATARLRPGAELPEGATDLTAAGLPLAPLLPDAFVAGPALALDDTRWVRQSLSSMLAARLVDAQPGERILDACAAPGGKTLALADAVASDGEVVACEVHEARARTLSGRLAAAGVSNVEVRTADATDATATGPGPYDRVLIDAPCSGLGVLGSRPDIRWKRTAEDIPGLVELQRNLLRAAVEVLAPGGRLVYSTCTLLAAENEQQAEWAVDKLPLEPVPASQALGQPNVIQQAGLAVPGLSNALRTTPTQHGTDGFFMASFRKAG